MPELSCAGCRSLLPDFFTGQLSRRNQRRLKAHLHKCDDCLNLAERQVTVFDGDVQTAIHNKVKQPIHSTGHRRTPSKGQALLRWGAVFFALMLFSSLMFFIYDTLTLEQQEARVRTWVEMRYTQGKLGTKEKNWTGWFPFYRHEVHYPLLQQTTSWDNRRLGTVVITQTLWWRTVDVILDQPLKWPILTVPNGTDSVADQGMNSVSGEDRLGTSTATWEALEQLPQSVTVDMAFSTRHFQTPLAMTEMLARYEIQLLSVYTYGGETAAEQRQIPPLELGLWSPSTGDVQVEESERILKDKVAMMGEKPVLTEERGLWEKRLNYVREHGFRTYGVSVRGTPQALLQLREVLELQQPTIIRIDWGYVLSKT